MQSHLVIRPLLFGGAIVAASLAFQVAVDRLARGRWRTRNNEIVGFYLAFIGALYGIALAFVLTAAWDNQESTRRITEQEALMVGSIAYYGRGLPHPYDDRVVDLAHLYALTAVSTEWPSLAQGAPSGRLDEVSARIGVDILRFVPSDVGGASLDGHLLCAYEQLRTLCGERRLRAEYEIPPAIWGLLAFGGVATIGLCGLLRVDGRVLHLVQTGLVATFITLSLLVTWDLQGPFEGLSIVRPTPFERLEGDRFIDDASWTRIVSTGDPMPARRVHGRLIQGEAARLVGSADR